MSEERGKRKVDGQAAKQQKEFRARAGREAEGTAEKERQQGFRARAKREAQGAGQRRQDDFRGQGRAKVRSQAARPTVRAAAAPQRPVSPPAPTPPPTQPEETEDAPSGEAPAEG